MTRKTNAQSKTADFAIVGMGRIGGNFARQALGGRIQLQRRCGQRCIS